jgi:hypothetical protein
MRTWPTRAEREYYEICGFIEHYARLPQQQRVFELVERREKPDYFVRDVGTGERFGVELTSVYLNDRSVPDEHLAPKPAHLFSAGIPYIEAELEQYKRRLLAAIADKVTKARAGYDLSYPLILSIYVNEYRAIFLDELGEWQQLVDDNEAFFDSCHPFSEIVFWSLPNDGVFLVRPEKAV